MKHCETFTCAQGEGAAPITFGKITVFICSLQLPGVVLQLKRLEIAGASSSAGDGHVCSEGSGTAVCSAGPRTKQDNNMQHISSVRVQSGSRVAVQLEYLHLTYKFTTASGIKNFDYWRLTLKNWSYSNKK